MIDCVIGRGKTYYPQVFLKECKCVVKKKIPEYTDKTEISSDDSDEEDSDEEN